MSADTRQVGKAIRQCVERRAEPTRDEVIETVSEAVEVPRGEVIDSLEWAIENGLLYPVEDSGETVVKKA